MSYAPSKVSTGNHSVVIYSSSAQSILQAHLQLQFALLESKPAEAATISEEALSNPSKLGACFANARMWHQVLIVRSPGTLCDKSQDEGASASIPAGAGRVPAGLQQLLHS